MHHEYGFAFSRRNPDQKDLRIKEFCPSCLLAFSYIVFIFHPSNRPKLVHNVY